MARKLTAKQEKFVREYLSNGRKMVEAYIHSYDCSDMSKASVYKEAQSLINHPLIAPRISQAIARIENETEVEVARVQREYARIAFADIRKAVRWANGVRMTEDEDGVPILESQVMLVPSAEIDDDTAAAISEIAMTKEGIKIKFHSKIAALDALSKIKGMFIEKVETKITIEDSEKYREMQRFMHENLTNGTLARPGGQLKVIDVKPQPVQQPHPSGQKARR